MAQHMNETTNPARPAIEVGVVMRREPVTGPMSRWQRWRWVLADVVPQQDLPPLPPNVHAGEAVALEPAEGEASAGTSHWLFPRLPVTLYRDDAEGYYLNLESPSPCFWVMWRLAEEGGEEAAGAGCGGGVEDDLVHGADAEEGEVAVEFAEGLFHGGGEGIAGEGGADDDIGDGVRALE